MLSFCRPSTGRRVGSSGGAPLAPMGFGSTATRDSNDPAETALLPDSAMFTSVLPCQNSSLPADTAQSDPRELPAAQGRMAGVRSRVHALYAPVESASCTADTVAAAPWAVYCRAPVRCTINSLATSGARTSAFSTSPGAACHGPKLSGSSGAGGMVTAVDPAVGTAAWPMATRGINSAVNTSVGTTARRVCCETRRIGCETTTGLPRVAAQYRHRPRCRSSRPRRPCSWASLPSAGVPGRPS